MKMGNMCVLTIHNTQHTDGGKWVCHITSKSDFDENGKNIQNTYTKRVLLSMPNIMFSLLCTTGKVTHQRATVVL